MTVTDARPHRVSIMGLDIDAMSEPQVVDRVVAAAAERRGGRVITPNLEHLRQYHEHPELRRHFAAADLVVADGMPLIWAAQLAGTPLPERVAGSNLIWSVSRAGGRRGLRVFLLGGNPGAAEEARDRLLAAAPGLEVVGTHCPPVGFEHDAAKLAAIEREVARADPQLVFVGLPFPKAEQLSERLQARFGRVAFVGVGVSLSFVAGDVARAPGWMQASGTEWLWRLVQEPRRLARRYLVDGLPFAVRLLAWGLGARLQRIALAR